VKNISINFFIILLSFSLANAQVRLAPQCNGTACWAACLEMVSTTVDISPKSQYFFINNSIYSSITPIQENPPFCSNLCGAIRMPALEVFNLASVHINGYKRFDYKSISLDKIKMLIGDNKPIIYNYLLDGSYSHIVVWDGIENYTAENNNVSLMRVKDPWEACLGNEYFMTYERYYIQNQNKKFKSNPSKYSISFGTSKSKNYSVVTSDKEYLKKVLYDKDSSKVVNDFFKKFTGLSNNFCNTVNLDKSLLDSIIIGEWFKVKTVDTKTLTEDNLKREFTISTLISPFKVKECIATLYQDSLKSIISTVKKKSSKNTYPFYNNWIIYHIEKGSRYREAITFIKSQEYDLNVADKSGLILKFLDTYFLLFKKRNSTNKDDYFVYDLYGDGFKKISNSGFQESKYASFEKFTYLLQSNFKEIFKKYYN
jgi:hypothetical protein